MSSEKEKLPWGLTQIAPGTIKQTLSKDQLEAFEHGTFKNKSKLSKKEQEELRKKQEEEATKEVLQDFCESFEKSNKTMAKMFVKGSIINTKEEGVQDKGSLYKPALKLVGKTAASPAPPEAPLNVSAGSELQAKGKRQEKEKKKSNLELFKEELKRIQTERDEKNRRRGGGRDDPLAETATAASYADKEDATAAGESGAEGGADGAHGAGARQPSSVEDPSTTNLFISNLSPKTNEQELMQRFGYYGLLASVKIMWPRSEDEKARGANCGFVAFMNRKDAEKALSGLDGLSVNGQSMRLSWSKAITLPAQPVYIPPELVEVTIPPPPSGLPFNAQPQDSKRLKQIRRQIKKAKKRRRARSTSSSDSRSRSRSRSSSRSSRSTRSSSSSSTSSEEEPSDEFSRSLGKALVKVVIPTERQLLCLIHRMIEYVVREGPAFEAMVMARELNNPQYRFLFENQSPAHGYYRWKLFSVLHGESVSRWRTAPFRMFKGGSYWQPPPLNRYTRRQASPDLAYARAKSELEERKGGSLSTEKRDRLEELLRGLATERKSISEAMCFCIENADKAQEVCECIADSLLIAETPLNKKVARLYLISDILHNCCAKVANASYYRRGFERILPAVFEHNSEVWRRIDGKMKSEAFKQKMLSCVRAWAEWAIYPNDYLVRLQNMFLGLVKAKHEQAESASATAQDDDGSESDVDGKPLEEEEEEDQQDADDDRQQAKSEEFQSKFVSRKWEAVDPEALEKQAVTTSKWDNFEVDSQAEEARQSKASALMNLASYSSEEDVDGQPMDSEDVDGKPMDSEDVDGQPLDSEDVDGKPMDEGEERKSWMEAAGMTEEEKRRVLREVEVKVLRYVDEVESGKVARLADMSLGQQAQEHRARLLQQASLDWHAAKASQASDQAKAHRPRSSSTSRSRSRSRSSNSNSNSNSAELKSSQRHRSSASGPSGADKQKKRRTRSRSRSRSPRNSRSYHHSSGSSSRKKYRN